MSTKTYQPIHAEEKPVKFNLQYRYRKTALKQSIDFKVNNYFKSSYDADNFSFFCNFL